MGFLCESDSGDSNVSTQNVVNNYPDWLVDSVKGNIEAAKGIAQTPYQSYTGDRVAGMSDMQTGALGMIQGMPNFGGNAAEYTNPWMNDVIDATVSDLRENQAMNLMDVGDMAHRSGAFGGTRHGVSEAEVRGNTEKTLGRIIPQLRAQGYEKARELYDTHTKQMMLGGGMKQDLGQRNLDVGYQDFLAQRNWPIEMLDIVNRSTSMTPFKTTGTTTTTTTPGGNNTAQTVGALGALAGGIGSFYNNVWA